MAEILPEIETFARIKVVGIGGGGGTGGYSIAAGGGGAGAGHPGQEQNPVVRDPEKAGAACQCPIRRSGDLHRRRPRASDRSPSRICARSRVSRKGNASVLAAIRRASAASLSSTACTHAAPALSRTLRIGTVRSKCASNVSQGCSPCASRCAGSAAPSTRGAAKACQR